VRISRSCRSESPGRISKICLLTVVEGGEEVGGGDKFGDIHEIQVQPASRR